MQHMNLLHPLILAAALIAGAPSCAAADWTAQGPRQVRLSLPGLQVDVTVPEGAAPIARQFWVLDGEDAGPVAREALRLVALECEVAPPLLVAVSDGHRIGEPGNQRGRDYTPVASDTPWARGEGGAAAFLARLREEALPAVDARFGRPAERGLYGHSYGGLFAAYAWLQAPALFDRWMLASPALYYGDDWAFRQSPAAAALGAKRSRMLLTAGSEEAWAVQGNARWAQQLAATPATAPELASVTLPGLGHLTGSPVSLMWAARWAGCTR